MKKIVSFLLMCLMIMPAVEMQAQASKEYVKEQKQNRKKAEDLAKKQAKTLKKGKWECLSSIPLQDALTEFYLETEQVCGGENRGMVQSINNAKSLSLGEKKLLMDAQTAYAQEIEAMVVATVTDQSSSLDESSLETLISNAVAKSKHEYKGDIRKGLIIYRKQPDGKTFEMRGYYIVNEKNAARAASRITDTVKQNAETAAEIEKAAMGK